MRFTPLRDENIGTAIIAAAVVGWLLALGLLFYFLT
jgi:hypothetical protein